MKFEERYQLQAPVEQTENGTTWSAQDGKLARKVVIAVVEGDASEELKARFTAQMTALATVRHASVVRVFDTGTTGDEGPFASMETFDDETLEARMRSGAPMRVDQAVRMIADLLGALTAVHAAGVVHGDIEPAHVLVKERGGRVTPKLVGFGLNRCDERGEGEERHRTLAYMAPAQACGDVRADEASDVYSVAALLFSLLTGRAPHRGADATAMRAAAGSRAVPRVADVREDLAGAIADAVDRALELDPAARYENAEAFSKALRAALIRQRNPGALQTVAGERTLDADDSDEALAIKRKEPATSGPLPKAATPKTSAKPSALQAASGDAPKAPNAALPKAALPKGALPKGALPRAELPKAELPSKAEPPKPELPKAEAAKAEAPAEVLATVATPGADDGLEFERLSGLLEAPQETSLEFERLSGLLEIPDTGPPKRVAPPPPKPRRDADGEASESASEAEAPEPVTAEGVLVAQEAAAIEDEPNAAVDTTEDAAKVVAAEEPPAPAAQAPREENEAAAEPVVSAPPSPPARARTPEAIPELDEGEPIVPTTKVPGWVWGACGVAAAAAIVVAIVASLGDGETATAAIEAPTSDETSEVSGPPTEPTGTAVADEGAADEPSSDEASADEASADEASADEAPPTPVVLTLTGLPEGAQITVDGETVSGSRIELSPSDADRTIEVRQDGHQPWTRTVAGDSSHQLAVALTPEPEAEPEPEPEPEPRAERESSRERRSASSSRRRTSERSSARSRTSERSSARSRTSERPSSRSRTSERSSSRRRTSGGGRPTAVRDPGF